MRHNGKMLSLLRDLIAIDSVNSGYGGKPDAEKEIADYLSELFQKNKWNVLRQPVRGDVYNLLTFHDGKKGAPWLVLCGHMDTVGVAAMTIPPFDPVIRDGKIYGRGSTDMKGALAAMIMAFERFLASGASESNIALLFTIDEEVDKTGAKWFCDHLPEPVTNIAGVIVAEPTMLQPVIAHCGILRFEMETFGKSHHSSAPHLGESAISHMVNVVRHMETGYRKRLLERRHSLCGNAQFSINLISGGSGINTIPDYCVAGADRRILPGENMEETLNEIREELDGLSAEHKCRLGKVLLKDPSLETAPTSTLAILARRVSKELGCPSDFAGAPYGTDAANFSAAGMDCIVAGPGSLAQAHQAEEWICLRQLDLAVEYFYRVMTEWR